MAKDNVVQFPYGKISNPVSQGGDEFIADISHEIMIEVINVLTDHEIMIDQNDKIFEDLGLVMNMMYAAIGRYYDKPHILHEIMDTTSDMMKEIKAEYDNR